MPIRYVCSRCGYVIFDSERDRGKWYWFGLPEPRVVAARCPRCGKPLKTSIEIDDVVVKR